MLSDRVKQLEDENNQLKEENEKLKDLVDLPRPKDCCNCRYYMQHYVKAGNSYGKTYSGHCVQGNRAKTRKPDETCRYYEKR